MNKNQTILTTSEDADKVATDLRRELNTYELDNATKALVMESCSESSKDFICEQLPSLTLEEMGFKTPPEGLNFDVTYEKSQLAEDIFKLLKERHATDVQVHVEDRVFDCHLTLLQIHTEYFSEFKCDDTIRISSVEVTAMGFEKVYEWMVNENASPQREHVVDMYMAARHFNMHKLLVQLWNRFDSRKFFDEKAAFRLYLEAVPHNTVMLHDLMVSRIQKFFLLAVGTEEYLELEPQHAHLLLSASNVCVNSEMEIYMSAVRWLMHDWRQRKEHASMIMEAVRFCLMPSWFTSSLKGKQADAEQQELVDNPQILNMINLGLSYAVTSQFMDKHSNLAEPLQMQKPLPRHWIIDETASHHHQYECPNWLYLDLATFNQFLLRITTEGGTDYMNRLKYATPQTIMSCCRNALQEQNEKQLPSIPSTSPSAGLMAMPNAPPPPSTE